MALNWGRVCGESVSQPFLPVAKSVFSQLPYVIGVTQLISGFLSEEIAPSVAAYSLCS